MNVTTTKRIDPLHLASIIGVPVTTKGGDPTTDVEKEIIANYPNLQQAITDYVLPNREANADTLRARAKQALQDNRDFLALANPTNAQVVAQVKKLTAQQNGIIRQLLGDFDGLD